MHKASLIGRCIAPISNKIMNRYVIMYHDDDNKVIRVHGRRSTKPRKHPPPKTLFSPFKLSIIFSFHSNENKMFKIPI